MRWHVVLSCLLAADTQAFNPAPVRWGGLFDGNVVVAPNGFYIPGKKNIAVPEAALPAKLSVWRQHDRLSAKDIPRLMANPNRTITWGAGFCVEASSDRSGAAVGIDRCTGAPNQQWYFSSFGRGQENHIQLRNTNMCMDVNGEGGLDGAPIVLQECVDKATESWRFDGPIPAYGPSKGTTVASPVRHVIVTFGLLVALGVGAWLWLSAWLWQWRRAQVVAASQHNFLLDAEHGGVSLTEPLTICHHRKRSTPAVIVPAVMATSATSDADIHPRVDDNMGQANPSFGDSRTCEALPAPVLQEIRRHASSELERLQWGCQVLRAIKDEDQDGVRESIRMWPRLRDVLHDGHRGHWTGSALLAIFSWIREDVQKIISLVNERFPDFAKGRPGVFSPNHQVTRRGTAMVAAGCMGLVGASTPVLAEEEEPVGLLQKLSAAAEEQTKGPAELIRKLFGLSEEKQVGLWSLQELYKALRSKKVQKVRFTADGKSALAMDKDGNLHEAFFSPDEASYLVTDLTNKGVDFNVAPPKDSDEDGTRRRSNGDRDDIVVDLLRFAITFGSGAIFGLIYGQGGLGNLFYDLTLGKSRSKIELEPQTGVTFDDVAGCEGSKFELTEVVDFLKLPDKYSSLGAKIPKGVILEGPPGTGKTLLARAVAGEAGVPFISCAGSEFVEMFVGVGAARVRDVFGQARKNAPCIVFIDEIDAVGRQRGDSSSGGGGPDERESTLNQILIEMDGYEGNTGVIVFAATNRADVLDQALVRAGRFDRRVPVNLPDVQGRKEILHVHCRGKPLAPELDLNLIAKRTTGFSGASLANLMNESAIIAARKGRTEISYSEVDYALDRILVGMQKATGTEFAARQRLVAYHEAGHAIMALLTHEYDMVTKVTIIPRTSGAGGFTLFTKSEEMLETGMLTKQYLCAQLSVLLGGRVAEELVYGKDYVTTGASNDLQQVRNIARRMVAQWGFANEELGEAPVAWEIPENDNPVANPRAASRATEKQIDEQVKAIVNSAYTNTYDTLAKNRAFLDTLCARLIEKETVDCDELVELRDSFSAVPA